MSEGLNEFTFTPPAHDPNITTLSIKVTGDEICLQFTATDGAVTKKIATFGDEPAMKSSSTTFQGGLTEHKYEPFTPDFGERLEHTRVMITNSVGLPTPGQDQLTDRFNAKFLAPLFAWVIDVASHSQASRDVKRMASKIGFYIDKTGHEALKKNTFDMLKAIRQQPARPVAGAAIAVAP